MKIVPIVVWIDANEHNGKADITVVTKNGKSRHYDDWTRTRAATRDREGLRKRSSTGKPVGLLLCLSIGNANKKPRKELYKTATSCVT